MLAPTPEPTSRAAREDLLARRLSTRIIGSRPIRDLKEDKHCLGFGSNIAETCSCPDDERATVVIDTTLRTVVTRSDARRDV